MKIKIFRNINIIILQKEINYWLKKNQPILIIQIKQSECAEELDSHSHVTVSIWYEDSDFITISDSNINTTFNGTFV
jgi:hypothetical protein